MESKLRTRREELLLSTSEVAIKLGVGQSSVVRLESSEAKGAISLSKLRQYAEALGCELTYELIPKKSISTEKSYAGLERSKQQQRRGRVGENLSQEVIEQARKLSPQMRVQKALELSDFTRSLR